jgi:hypothetical protein
MPVDAAVHVTRNGPGDAAAASGDAAVRSTVSALRGFEPLTRAERLLVRAWTRGEIARIGLQHPPLASPAFVVRASLLAQLASGRAAGAALVRGRAVQLVGAWVIGRLQLADLQVPASLWLFRCVFDAAIELDGARIAGSLSLRDCRLPGLHADRCELRGDLVVDAGTSIPGEVRLRGARIGGDVNAAGARLGRRTIPVTSLQRPWAADGAQVGGDVRMHRGFESIGEVRWVGAQVDGDFDASQARLSGHIDRQGLRHEALNLDRIRIGGNLVLDSGFAAAGTVSAVRARVGGDLRGSGATFDLTGDSTWGEDGASLRLDRARIDGALVLRELPAPIPAASLADARVSTLDDDDSTWDEELVLDGFEYQRFAATAPSDAEFRLGWLGRQRGRHLGTDLRAQPWRQLIGVLRDMGRDDDARRVAIGRERHLRRVGRVGSALPRGLRGLARLVHALFGVLAGYGQRPLRIFGWLLALVVLSGVGYYAGDRAGGFVPTRAAEAPAPFNPWAYSLERLVPMLDLQQARHWTPTTTDATAVASPGDVMRWLGWAEAGLGWAGVLLLVASVAGWPERDRRR